MSDTLSDIARNDQSTVSNGECTVNSYGHAKSKKPEKKCSHCGGDKRVFIVDRVVQGQDYGPETEGHYEKCPYCI